MTTTKTNGIVRTLRVAGAGEGSLAGLTFLAKDLFDVAGFVTGAGNPDWLNTHAPARQTASAVTKILQAGATMVGKSCTDELAYSIDGVNVHYGTPLNPQFPDRIPGGSSSGSGSAVAAKLVDFALGTDTGGSIRVPAAYCGIWGFRPTHGLISLDGIVPLAPSFDTVGWLARDPVLLKRCGSILLPASEPQLPIRKLLIAADLLDLASESIRPAIMSALEKIREHFATVDEIALGEIGGLDALPHYRIIQGWQAWQCHGAWIESAKPTFDPTIKERFDIARNVVEKDYNASAASREALAREIALLLPPGTALCLPTCANLPPLLNASAEEIAHNRVECMKLTCLAPLARVPQMTMPISLTETTTVGLSFMAGGGQDIALLELGDALAGNCISL